MLKYKSSTYNWIFDEDKCLFLRWGKTYKDDPTFSPIGPEVVSITISEPCLRKCQFCYRSAGDHGNIMSLSTFKQILEKLPSNVTEISFGVGSLKYVINDIETMFKLCREHNITPNITLNPEDAYEYADKLSLCGGVAISCYDPELVLKACEKLRVKMVSTHIILAEEFRPLKEKLYTLLKMNKSKNLKQITFLTLKPFGSGYKCKALSKEESIEWIMEATKLGVAIGGDSCNAILFEELFKTPQFIQRCSAGCFHCNIDVHGDFHTCSFSKDENLNVLQCKDFVKDIWNHSYIIEKRNKSISNEGRCMLL